MEKIRTLSFEKGLRVGSFSAESHGMRSGMMRQRKCSKPFSHGQNEECNNVFFRNGERWGWKPSASRVVLEQGETLSERVQFQKTGA